jgi:hypothetical protein
MARPAPSVWTSVALAALVATSPVLAEDWDRPSGTYIVVDHRIASGVAATAASLDPAARARELGQAVDYGDSLVWYDGRLCDDWQAAVGPDPDPVAADPHLADLELASASGPGNRPLSLTCAGAPFAAAVAVDDRVQIAFVPNGTMFVVLERVPTADEARQVQQALRDLGHYAGPVDGRFDDGTRAALAAFVATLGVPAPRVGVLTEAVYDALVAG